MPEIPRYGQPKIGLDATQQVAPLAPLETGQGNELLARAAGNLASSLGAAGQSIGQALAKRQERLDEENDVAAAFDAEADFERRRKSILFDKDAGYLTVARGEKAVAAAGVATEAVNEAYKASSERLTNARQKDLFARRTFGAFVDTGAAIAKHAASQGDVVKKERFDALRAEKLDTIARFAQDPNADTSVFAEATSSMVGAIQGEGARLGAPAEATERELARFRHDAVKVVLDGFLGSNRVKDAAEVFAVARDALGVDAPRYWTAIREAGRNADAELRVGVLAKMATADNGRLDTGQFMDWVESAKVDTDVKEKMRSLAANRVSSADHAWQRQTRDVFNRASAAYEKRHSMADVNPVDAEWLKDPENGAVTYWQALEDRARADVDYWRVASARPAKETPAQRLSEFELRADMVDHPEKYIAMTPGEFATLARPKLSPQGFESVGQAFNALRNNAQNKTDPNAKLPDAVEDTVLTMGREAGVFPKKGTKTIKLGDPSTWGEVKTPAGNAASDVYLGVVGKLQKAASEYRQTHGKPPPPDYLRGLAAKELARVKVTDKGIVSWFDSEKETAAADAALAGKPSRPVIPKAEEDQIRAALRAQGMEETEDNIVRLYEAAHAAPAPRQLREIPPEEALVPLE